MSGRPTQSYEILVRVFERWFHVETFSAPYRIVTKRGRELVVQRGGSRLQIKLGEKVVGEWIPPYPGGKARWVKGSNNWMEP